MLRIRMSERLEDGAMVKGTMLRAHLDWGLHRFEDPTPSLLARISPASGRLLGRTVLSTDWIPFGCLVEIDRALAALDGRPEDEVYRDLGRHSASLNLGGVYRSFVSSEPHRFLERTSVLHHQFQNFGRSTYARTGDRSGRVTIEGYTSFSPVFCVAGLGYFQEALALMHAPGPIVVEETSCHCRGDSACVFEASW